ncbi:hypothetical protein [Sphingobium sp. LSP13-1-1.1]|uniref:hypothetical protein n=1 Tax=Sphingobium sp. LSP13-1-1.1 TaxID=3135234 RepID=UPI003429BDD1
MNYWIENMPEIETTGDNVRVMIDRGYVMPRYLALRLARALLAAVAELEDRPAAPVIPITKAG